MAQRENLIGVAAFAASLLLSPAVHADECNPGTRVSTCFDADSLWVPAAPSRFVSIPTAVAEPARSMSIGLAFGYLSRPVTLRAPAPDPSGREVAVVDRVVSASLTASYSPVRHLELGTVLPFDLDRAGSGLAGVTSQTGESLRGTALRDLRIGAGHDLVLAPANQSRAQFSAMSRLELSVPTGDREGFAGARGPVLAPGIVLSVRARPVLVSVIEGMRFRSAVDFADVRIGSQLLSGLGASAEVLPDERLFVSAEATVLPSLASTTRTLPDGSSTKTTLTPAEWTVSVGTRLRRVILDLGGGGAIPLSGATRTAPDGTETTEHFAGVTSPRFRIVLGVRYVPGD